MNHHSKFFGERMSEREYPYIPHSFEEFIFILGLINGIFRGVDAGNEQGFTSLKTDYEQHILTGEYRLKLRLMKNGMFEIEGVKP